MLDSGKKFIYVALLTLTTWFAPMLEAATIETTIVEVSITNTPYNKRMRLKFSGAENTLLLECTNEYLNTGERIIDLSPFLAELKKANKWMETNKTAKLDVEKYVGMLVKFKAYDDGGSFAIVAFPYASTQTVYCYMQQQHVQALINGLENGFDSALAKHKNSKDPFN